MNEGAYERLLELLDGSGLPKPVSDCVLAAADGSDALAAHLGAAGAPPAPSPKASEASSPAPAFLQEIAVEGFRGVGTLARLQFEPGPGLTLVVGRNGSGKSSFAEALEVLLTGTTLRWAERTKVWQEGWRNLHHAGQTRIGAKFRIDGTPEVLEISRTWNAGVGLDGAGPLEVRGPYTDWRELGWERPLEQYRPILSYNELGTMFSSRAAALYEALSAVLGLEEFDAMLATLRDARLECERSGKEEKQARQTLRQQLDVCDDERAPSVGELLAKRQPDLDAVLAAAGESADADGASLAALSTLEIPTAEVVAEAFASLKMAAGRVVELKLGDTDRFEALAELLQTGLDYHHAHGDAKAPDCPLCGAERRLDAAWAKRTTAEIAELRGRSRELRAARAGQADALRVAREQLFSPATATALLQAEQAGLELDGAPDTWSEWLEVRNQDDADFVDAGAEIAARLCDALQQARTLATADRRRREDAWRPLHESIGDWAALARRTKRDSDLVVTLKAAESWLKNAIADLRRERLAPVVDAAKANWNELRHESNVALGKVELRKQGNQRYAAFDVAIDGADASAFGVMSQGELSALAISVFLPRAALPGSPFWFMVIDDPVQSMDPAKVDGLARVLARAAKNRQLIVFTHDERLPEAIRQLAIDARIMRVQRRAQSKVEIVAARPPSDRYIGEALAIAKADDLPLDVKRRVIPGFCRSAIEAACESRIRRRLFAQGMPHAEIDEQLEQLTSLNAWLAKAFGLALAQGKEIRAQVTKLGGHNAAEVVDIARKGSHAEVSIDAIKLVEGAKRLVRALEESP
jgi:ABC-type Mn2+/Zn2+ transport system ATPase subunit